MKPFFMGMKTAGGLVGVLAMTASVSCGSGPTEETVHGSEVWVVGRIADSEAEGVPGVLVRVFQDTSLSAGCSGEYTVTAGRDTTDAAGEYALRSLHLTADTVCAVVSIVPPAGTGYSETVTDPVLLPYRYPGRDELDTVRVDATIERTAARKP